MILLCYDMCLRVLTENYMGATCAKSPPERGVVLSVSWASHDRQRMKFTMSRPCRSADVSVVKWIRTGLESRTESHPRPLRCSSERWLLPPDEAPQNPERNVPGRRELISGREATGFHDGISRRGR